MSIEQIRGCGYRKVGGLYLCGGGQKMVCDRLPYELKVCPVCGAGIKFTRGWTWLDWLKYAGNHEGCHEAVPAITSGVLNTGNLCPVCFPETYPQPYGLLWVGESFYTPETFIQEAIQMGVSKRIAAIPRNLKLGETWVLFAHKKAVTKVSTYPNPELPALPDTVEYPGIFYAFRPQVLELLIWESEATEDKLVELEHRGIKPIVIPDGDIDHDPNTKLKITEAEKSQLKFTRSIQEIRESMGR